MARKPKKPTAEELEAQANAILREDLLDAIRTGFESLQLPSNDPEYLKKLQISDAARSAIANKITQVDIVPNGAKSYVGLGNFLHHEAQDIARRLSDHFETKIRQHEPE